MSDAPETPAPPPQARPSEWHAGQPYSAGQGVGRSRGKIMALAAVVLFLAGGILAWILMPRPFRPARFLPLWIDQYRDPHLTAPPWTERDRTLLRSLTWRDNNAFTSQERKLLEQELENLDRAATGDPVVIYLSAVALVPPGTGQKPQVRILSADSRLDDPNTWLPVSRVFELLRRCKASNRLLLLDLTHPFVYPPAGLLVDDLASRLEPELQAAIQADPGLLILTACAPGQISQYSPELGQSAFGHFIYRALKGQAEDRQEGRISVRELVSYVIKGVDAWSQATRGERQTPRLLGPESKDFPLVALERDPRPEVTPLEAAYPDWLLKAWKTRDEWLADRSFRVIVPQFRQLQELLLLADRQWRSGVSLRQAVETRLTEVRTQRAERLRELERPGSGPTLAAAVAALKTPPEKPSPADKRKIRDLAVLQAELKKPMAQPDLARQRKLDEGRNELLAPFKDKLVELCEYVFTVAIEEPEPSRDLLAFLLSLLPKEPPPEYREIKALTRVAVKLPFGEQRPWPARAAGDFLRIERLAAHVEDADPRALDWMRLQYSSARKLRNDAELLFQESSPPPNLGPALEVWRKLEAAVRDISQAQETRDRMQVDLPLYVVYLESALRQDSGLVVDSLLKDRFLALDQAVDALLVLRKELEEPATSEARLEAVRKRLPELLEPFTERGAIGRLLVGADADEIKKLAGRRETGDVNDARSMEALLGLSWLTASQRAEIWSAWRALAGRQNRLFLDRIATGLGSVNVPDGRWEARQHGLDKNRRIHGFWRAHASLSLLKLELPPTLLADLEPALRQAADLRQTPEKADLAAMAGSLREFWDKARQARESRQP